MSDQSIKVGMIGYKFMGKAHSHALREVDKFFDTNLKPELEILCGRTEKPLRQAQQKWGWKDYSTSWEKVVQRSDLDLLIVGAPNYVHRDICVEAAKNGINILCEKPLARNLSEAREMVNAVEDASVKHMIGFNYRRIPAITLARQLVEQGRLGDIYHFRAQYLQDWLVDPEAPRTWRLDSDKAGSGTLGDLGSHVIDLARYLVSEVEEVVAELHTFVEKRPLPGTSDGTSISGDSDSESEEMGEVTVDDMHSAILRFENGARGTLETTRFATGRKNAQWIEINGSRGSLRFDLEEMNYLNVFYRDDPDQQQGFRRISVTDPGHPYYEAWWPPGHTIGYQHTFVHQMADLLDSIRDDADIKPNFHDGLACQRVMDAIETSDSDGGWVSVS